VDHSAVEHRAILTGKFTLANYLFSFYV